MRTPDTRDSYGGTEASLISSFPRVRLDFSMNSRSYDKILFIPDIPVAKFKLVKHENVELHPLVKVPYDNYALILKIIFLQSATGDQTGSQVNFYYGAPAPYAESVAPSHHSTYAHYYDDEEDGWHMPDYYNEA